MYQIISASRKIGASQIISQTARPDGFMFTDGTTRNIIHETNTNYLDAYWDRKLNSLNYMIITPLRLVPILQW